MKKVLILLTILICAGVWRVYSVAAQAELPVVTSVSELEKLPGACGQTVILQIPIFDDFSQTGGVDAESQLASKDWYFYKGRDSNGDIIYIHTQTKKTWDRPAPEITVGKTYRLKGCKSTGPALDVAADHLAWSLAPYYFIVFDFQLKDAIVEVSESAQSSFQKSSAPALETAATGNIIFLRDGNIWIANSDGSGQKQLTSDGNNASPRFSRDGKKIAFIKRSAEIWTMNSDGSNASKLPLDEEVKSAESSWDIFDIQKLVWSPKGDKIALEIERKSSQEFWRGGIYVVDLKASPLKMRLLNNFYVDDPSDLEIQGFYRDIDWYSLDWSSTDENEMMVTGTCKDQVRTDPGTSGRGFLVSEICIGHESGKNFSKSKEAEYDARFSPVILDFPLSSSQNQYVIFRSIGSGKGNFSLAPHEKSDFQKNPPLKIEIEGETPAWSGDGNYIVFEHAKTEGGIRHENIFTLDIKKAAAEILSGKEPPQSTQIIENGKDPDWSWGGNASLPSSSTQPMGELSAASGETATTALDFSNIEQALQLPPASKELQDNWVYEGVEFSDTVQAGTPMNLDIYLKSKNPALRLKPKDKVHVILELYDKKDPASLNKILADLTGWPALVYINDYEGEVVEKTGTKLGKAVNLFPENDIIRVKDVIFFPPTYPDQLKITVVMKAGDKTVYTFGYKDDFFVYLSRDTILSCGYGFIDASLDIATLGQTSVIVQLAEGQIPTLVELAKALKDGGNLTKGIIKRGSEYYTNFNSGNYFEAGKSLALLGIEVFKELIDPLKWAVKIWNYLHKANDCALTITHLPPQLILGLLAQWQEKEWMEANGIILESPASLMVNVVGGKNLGFDAAGNIVNELGADGAVSAEHPALVLFKGIQTFDVTVSGKENGTFNLNILQSRNEKEIGMITYSEVPITPQAKATVRIAPEGNERDYTLALDKDGNGTIDDYQKVNSFEVIKVKSPEEKPAAKPAAKKTPFSFYAIGGIVVLIVLAALTLMILKKKQVFKKISKKE
jgi:Tol biopolymer transport system component